VCFPLAENVLTEKQYVDSELARISAERDALKNEQAKLSETNKSLSSELKRTMTTHSTGNQQLESLTQQYQELQDRSFRDIEELQNTNNTLLQQIAELQQKVGQSQNQVSVLLLAFLPSLHHAPRYSQQSKQIFDQALARKTQEIQQLQAKLREQELFASSVEDMKNTLQQRNSEIAMLKQKQGTVEQQLAAKTNEANKAKQGLQTAINELRKQREETEKLAEQILEVELSKAEEVERLNAVIADLQAGRR
jgi:hypothetical protein